MKPSHPRMTAATIHASVTMAFNDYLPLRARDRCASRGLRGVSDRHLDRGEDLVQQFVRVTPAQSGGAVQLQAVR